MTEQEQPTNVEAPQGGAKSYTDARAEFLAAAPDEVATKFVESEAEFSKSWARATQENGITDPADQQQLFNLLVGAAQEKGVSVMDRIEMGSVLERSLDRFHQWKAAARKQAILSSSDEDFAKYDEQRTKERHRRQREQLLDSALQAQEKVMAEHSKVKASAGKEVWQMTPDEFKAYDDRRTALRRASAIERGRLDDDSFRMRVAEERSRREKK